MLATCVSGSTMVTVEVSPDLILAIDAWRLGLPDIPERDQAARILIQYGLGVIARLASLPLPLSHDS